MALHRIKPPRRRLLVALLVTAAVPLAGFLYYRMDEAPSDVARNLSERPPRTVADADNALVYLLGLGAADGADPIEAGRTRIDAYLAGARREALDAETVPEVRHDADRDGFKTLCRTSLGNCSAWALQHREALLKLADANRLRLTRLDKAATLTHWQDPPLSNDEFLVIPATTIRLYFSWLAVRAGSGDDPVALGQELARSAGLWRRATEQSDWLISKVFAVTFLADSQRLLVDIYAHATHDQRRELDALVDTVLAEPSAAGSSLALSAYDVLQTSAVTARALHPGLPAALRQCWSGEELRPAWLLADEEEPASCSELLVDNLTFLPQATMNRLAPFADAARRLLAAAPEGEADALRDYHDRITALRADLKPARRLPPAYNEAGERHVLQSLDRGGQVIDYRRRLNDFELLRRMLAIRVAALRADVPDGDMAAFIDTLPAALRHPYPDKAIRWDGIRGVLTAPTAIEGIFDEGGIDLSYRDNG